MSDYQYFLSEKTQIDELIGKGFVITHVTENLSGAIVDFVLPDKTEKQQLHHHSRCKEIFFKVFISLIVMSKYGNLRICSFFGINLLNIQ